MPPRGASGGSRHGIAKEFELSNSTTAKFLGAVPKAWMDTHSLSGIKPSHDRPDNPRTRDPQAPMRSRPTTAIQPTVQEVHQPCLPTQASKPMEAYPTAPSITPRHRSSPIGKAMEVENVLPSPAPSDECHGSVCIIESEEENAPPSRLTNSSAVDPLKALTDEFGGVEEIEKRLRAAEAQQRAETPASRPSFAKTTGLVRPEKRTLEEQSERPRKMPSRQGTGATSPVTTPVNEGSPPDPVLQHLKNVLEQSSVARKPPARDGKVTSSRLRLLQDALKASDYVYLVLHQILCLYSRSPNSVFESYNGFNERHVGGLKLLAHILVDNSQLDATAVAWFSTFPFPAEIMLRNHATFRAACTKVLEFLERFHERWTKLKDDSRRRSCPPSANELIVTLSLDSTVLQGVLYRAIYRDIWRANYCQCTQESEKIFLRTQQEAYEQGRPKPGLLGAENQHFIIQVQRLWLRHTTQCLPPAAVAGHTNPQQQQQQQSAPWPSMVSNANSRETVPPSANLNIDATAAQTLSSNRWTMYTPTVPSSPAQTSPNTRTNSATTFQPNVSWGTLPAAHSVPRISLQPTGATPVAPTVNRQSSWTLHNPPINGTPQSSPAHAANNEASRGSSLSRNSSAPSQVWQQEPSHMLRGAAGPQSTFPPSISRGHADQLLQSYGRTSPNAGRSPRALSTSASTAVQPPAPRFVGNGFSPAAVHNSYMSPFPPPIPASSTQVANVFIRPLDQFPPAITAISTVHQAHLRSPIIEAAVLGNNAASGVKFYTYIREIRTSPDTLHAKKRYLKWAWEESKEGFESLATCSQTQDGSPARMQIHSGSHFVRLRCVRSNKVDDESDWVAAENTWPEGMAIIMNGKGLDVRRKVHHSKDLPVNITTCIKAGENVLIIAISQLPQGDDTTYTFGLESIHLTNRTTVKSEVKTLSWLEARDRILKRSGLADPDVQVLDRTITLDVTDPYSSSLCHTPARGSACRHNQCFDLDIFLSTRSGKTPTEPCGPDQLKCPICGADARPKSLVIDGFFIGIRQELEKLKRLDVKAVVVDERGKWRIKEVEGAGEAGDRTTKRTSMSMSVDPRAGPNPNTNEVIELDDED